MRKFTAVIVFVAFSFCLVCNASLLKVGIFDPVTAGGSGEGGAYIFNMLKDSDSFLAETELFSDMKRIKDFDIVIFSCVKNMGRQPANFRELICEYVHNGGGAILLHDSVGNDHALSPSLFPTVFSASGTREKDGSFIPVGGFADHPILKSVESFTPALKDEYVPMRPAKLAKTLITDSHGAATVVAGDYGKGRVVGIASIPCYKNNFGNMNENRMLINSIFWAAGKKMPDEDGISKTELLRELLKLRKNVEALTGKNNDLQRQVEQNYMRLDNRLNFIFKTIKKL